ncbi:MAG TPA: VCBS repeat-containing protein, partial [Verrucomicrobiales bacterium]|nr:VCBS repeat-containing protein [Verrucomicrobiales bacterium]
MSKRNVNISATAALLILSTIFTIVGWHSGWVEFGDPVFTEVIPEKRPTRLDQKKLEAFSNKPINEILEFLLAEAATTVTEPPVIPPPAPAPALLGMLPDAPLPFPGSAAPRDEENLKKFITGMQQDKEGEPSKSEQWQFNLALAAIQVDPSKIPEAIRLNTHPVPESETFSVRLVPRDGEISGPFAIGLFNRENGPGIVSGGGTNLSSLKAEGALDSLGSLSGTVPGNGIFPADFDADGDLDLFVTRGDGLPNSLLRNDGGKFEDVTISLGLLSFDDTTTAAWIDYDGDELLDLLVGSKD